MLAVVGAASLVLAPRSQTAASFFSGRTAEGQPPGVFMLTFSQVTTWIFARSLLNAGILGYAFGIAGAVAYTAYYGPFLTGAFIVEHLREQHGVDNVQEFLRRKFGGVGTTCYNALVSLRLLSEVFANLLAVGIVFGTAGDRRHFVCWILSLWAGPRGRRRERIRVVFATFCRRAARVTARKRSRPTGALFKPEVSRERGRGSIACNGTADGVVYRDE